MVSTVSMKPGAMALTALAVGHHVTHDIPASVEA
jgi:hypothetical protein